MKNRQVLRAALLTLIGLGVAVGILAREVDRMTAYPQVTR